MLAIGVMEDGHAARLVAGRRPLQHLKVAIGVAEREDRPTPDDAIDPHRLAGAIIDELDRGLLEERGFAVRADLELVTPDEPTTCSGGIP